MMKIGIIGTRGIPNNYGGFEQFAENFSVYMAEKGHSVYVYNSNLHPFRHAVYKGVNIIRKYDPENRVGTAGQFIYDALCIIDARRRNFDIILQLGYTSSSVFSNLFPAKVKVVTNMDGLEWKRSKYSKRVQQFLLYAEKLAVSQSDYLISDSPGIKNYIKTKYGADSEFIAYGANLFTSPDEKYLQEFRLEKFSYNILIARLEPENNIETIIRAHIRSKTKEKLVIIGSFKNRFGSDIFVKYNIENILFLGAIYEQRKLNNLRYFSNIYFHGHTVGGTNPSLIEAMASNTLIIAHNNIFNKSVLGEDAFYFEDEASLSSILQPGISKENYPAQIESNRLKVVNEYSLQHIHEQTEKFLLSCL